MSDDRIPARRRHLKVVGETMRGDVDSQGRDTSVVSWRRDRLVRAGFPLPLAARVSRDGAYDIHALVELVERGCPPELAVRIVAPLAGPPMRA